VSLHDESPSRLPSARIVTRGHPGMRSTAGRGSVRCRPLPRCAHEWRQRQSVAPTSSAYRLPGVTWTTPDRTHCPRLVRRSRRRGRSRPGPTRSPPPAGLRTSPVRCPGQRGGPRTRRRHDERRGAVHGRWCRRPETQPTPGSRVHRMTPASDVVTRRTAATARPSRRHRPRRAPYWMPDQRGRTPASRSN
jgi:hypothetical protein